MIETNRDVADKQLYDIGREHEKDLIATRGEFIFHKTEDGREFYKPAFQGDWQCLEAASYPCVYASTLQAVADYINTNPDNIDITKVIVHVRSFDSVAVVSRPTGGWLSRNTHLEANAVTPDHHFGRAISPDMFVPWLQSCFVPSEDLTKLLAVSGNIVDTSELHALDDGVSQNVTIKSGAARKSTVDVPSPAILFPFSTFCEIDQPARKFVFRLASSPLTCSLIEADGGAWKIQAINSVADWLRTNITIEGVKIIA